MLDESRFTICTVSFGHAPYLSLNWNLSEKLNEAQHQRIDWLVAENAPAGKADRITSDHEHFKIFPGSSNTSLGASHHHAEAMNALLAEVKTRFVLILDPDFYILRPHWLVEVETYMRANKLAFFGVPWHPRYIENYRYFPAVHCMFIDRAMVPLEAIDFRPILEQSKNEKAPDDASAEASLSATLMCKFGFHHRQRRPWDTGTRVFDRFGNDPTLQSECVTPVYRLPRDWIGTGNPLTLKNRLLELILPDNLCYLPKQRASYTQQGFKERGWNSMDLPVLWEEHIWKNAPFGLHIRRSYSMTKRDAPSEFELCRNFIASHLSHPASA